MGHDNLGGTAHAPPAAGDPMGYYDAAGDVHHVVYRSADRHLHELHWHGVAPVQYGGNLTGAIGAPHAAGDPSAMINAAGFNIVAYRAVNGQILSVYWKDGPSGLDNLSGTAGTPVAANDPFAYYTAHNDMHQVVYRAANGHIWELYWPGVKPVAGWDLTDEAIAPAAVGTPIAYYSAVQNTKHVVYRSADGRLHDLWWLPGGSRVPQDIDLTEFSQAPKAADDPFAFAVDLDGSHHVTYRAANNHIYEIRWP